MPFVIDPHSGVPAFRQLIGQVKRYIVGGLLKPGDEMPSIRTLSVPLGVNPMTISKAYNLLVREGVLDRRPGLPLTVRPVAAEEMEERKREELREALKSTVMIVTQLGIRPDVAMSVFHEMFEREKAPGGDKGEGASAVVVPMCC